LGGHDPRELKKTLKSPRNFGGWGKGLKRGGRERGATEVFGEGEVGLKSDLEKGMSGRQGGSWDTQMLNFSSLRGGRGKELPREEEEDGRKNCYRRVRKKNLC